jgi:predicted RNA binding protein YcfA (HicA-like mRNA interferase family)
LCKVGYAKDHQRGSHIVLRHADPPHRRITVPDHREIAKGTLRAIIRQAGLTVDEFRALM